VPRGGARPNAGRRKGVRNKLTTTRAEIIAKAANSGLTPLEFMLEVLRDETKPFKDRFDAACHAAPYVHPRLAAVEHSGNEDKPLAIEVVSGVTRIIDHEPISDSAEPRTAH
jgi:hypothetical protein